MEKLTYKSEDIEITIDVTENNIHEFMEKNIRMLRAIWYSEESIDEWLDRASI